MKDVNESGIFVGYVFEDYELHPNKMLKRNGKVLVIPPKELRILSCLVERSGEVVSKDELFQYAWGFTSVSDESLTRCIYSLRNLLADNKDRNIICTLYGRGYAFNLEVTKHGCPEQMRCDSSKDNENISGSIQVGFIGEDYTIGNLAKKINELLEIIEVNYPDKGSNYINRLVDKYFALCIQDKCWIEKDIHSRLHAVLDNILMFEPFNAELLAMRGTLRGAKQLHNPDLHYFVQAKKIAPNNVNVDYYIACYQCLKKDYLSAITTLNSAFPGKSERSKVEWLMSTIRQKLANENNYENSSTVRFATRDRFNQITEMDSRWSVSHHVYRLPLRNNIFRHFMKWRNEKYLIHRVKLLRKVSNQVVGTAKKEKWGLEG